MKPYLTKILLSLVVALSIAIIVLLSHSPSAEFIGSSNSRVFHNAGCKWVDDIPSDAVIEFKSFREARKAGYLPCRTCKPYPYTEVDKTRVIR